MINIGGAMIKAWEEGACGFEPEFQHTISPTQGCHHSQNCHPNPSQHRRLLISRGHYHSTNLGAATFDPNFKLRHGFIRTVDNYQRSAWHDLACHKCTLANNNNLLSNNNHSYSVIAKTCGKYRDYHNLGHSTCNSNNSSSSYSSSGIRYHHCSSIADNNNNNNTFSNKRYYNREPTITNQLPPCILIGGGKYGNDFNGNTIATRDGDGEKSFADDEEDVDRKLACISISNHQCVPRTWMDMERFSFGRWKSGVIFQQRTSSSDLMQCNTAPIRRKISYDPGIIKDINDNHRLRHGGSAQSSIDGDAGLSRASFELDIISETGDNARKTSSSYCESRQCSIQSEEYPTMLNIAIYPKRYSLTPEMTTRRRSSCHSPIKEVAETPQMPKKKMSDPSCHRFMANVPLNDAEPCSSARSASWVDKCHNNTTPRIHVSEPQASEKIRPSTPHIGTMSLLLQYFPVRKRLRVAVLSASTLLYSSEDMNLKLRTPNKAYVKLCLMPSKVQKQRGRQVCGKIMPNSDHRHSNFLIFNEEFFFDDISAIDLQTKSLIVKICETYTKGSASLRLNDPYSSNADGPCITITNNIKRRFQFFNEFLINRYKDVTIGQICVPFLPLVNQLQKKKELNLCKSLQLPVFKKAGKIQFSLLLEADDRRLTVNIIRVENLPRYGSSLLPDPYVKVTMDQGESSKPQSKQTRKIKSCLSTNFKEAVMFLIAKDLSLLDSTSITLTVCDNRSKNTIGSLIIGENSKYKHLVDLWRNVILQNGKTFKVSHTLDSTFGLENEVDAAKLLA